MQGKPKIKVQLVSDKSYDLKVVASHLISKEYELKWTRNPEEAKKFFWQYRPAILLLSFSTVGAARIFYKELLLLKKGDHVEKWYQVIVLCDMKEGEEAFIFVDGGVFDDYCTFKPIYDAHRLKLCMKLAINRGTYQSKIENLESELADSHLTLKCVEKVRENLEVAHTGLVKSIEAHISKFEEKLTGPESKEIIQILNKSALQGYLKDLAETQLQPELGKFNIAIIDSLKVTKSKNQTILVVEDEEPVRKMCVETLQTLGGYHVIQASNAAIAWIMVMKNPPDLMLVDIHLPGESGIEFMQKCKKKPELSQIPAIVVSGDSARQSVIESSKAGAVSFMVKPVTAYDLLSTVEQVLNPSEETPT